MRKELNVLSIESNALNANESLSIVGGDRCGCACRYANSGGSSTSDNYHANKAGNLVSKGYRLDDCVAFCDEHDSWGI